MKQSLILLFTFLSSFLLAQSESEYIRLAQIEIGGASEVSVPSGRVDLVTDSVAYEVELAANWKEAIGQSLWYSLQTGKKPGIIIVKETPEQFKYVQQLNSALQHGDLADRFVIKVFPDDFPLAAMADTWMQEPVKLTAESNKPTVSPDQISKTKTDFWLTKKSKKRHNKSCDIYEKSNGNYCTKDAGTAAGCCGG